MARKINSQECTAWVQMGDSVAGAILPCRVWGEGHCLKDKRQELGLPNVCIVEGLCMAGDVDAPYELDTTEPLIDDGSNGIRLDSFAQTALRRTLGHPEER